MSRFDGIDDDGEGVPSALWNNNLRQILKGRRGQALLAEIEAILVAMPRKRLIRDRLFNKAGAACFVGAYIKAKEPDANAAFFDWAVNAYDTAEAGHDAGLPYKLAAYMVQLNDEDWGGATPERRYKRALEWVREQQRTPGAGVPRS